MAKVVFAADIQVMRGKMGNNLSLEVPRNRAAQSSARRGFYGEWH